MDWRFPFKHLAWLRPYLTDSNLIRSERSEVEAPRPHSQDWDPNREALTKRSCLNEPIANCRLRREGIFLPVFRMTILPT